MSLRWLPVIALASFVAHHVCLLWNIHHTPFPHLQAIADEKPTFALRAVLLGVIAGIVASGFLWLTHFLKSQSERWITSPLLRPIVGGCILIALVMTFGIRDFLGLGVTAPHPQSASILAAFSGTAVPEWSWFGKLCFTAITIGFGFKGGEVTPLFFMGATLGNAFGFWQGIASPHFAALGLVAVFAAASKCPFACTCLAAELFGFHILPMAAVCCFIASWVQRQRGLYQNASAS